MDGWMDGMDGWDGWMDGTSSLVLNQCRTKKQGVLTQILKGSKYIKYLMNTLHDEPDDNQMTTVNGGIGMGREGTNAHMQ